MENLKFALDCEDEDIVINGFIDRYEVSYEEAKSLFNETKKWLWLSNKNVQSHSLFIDKPLLIIDEMWHTFILHTKQYYNFCMKNFNKFLHHIPTSNKEKELIEEHYQKNPEKTKKEFEDKLRFQYSLIYEYLGSETLINWYENIPSKYTPEYISSIKK